MRFLGAAPWGDTKAAEPVGSDAVGSAARDLSVAAASAAATFAIDPVLSTGRFRVTLSHGVTITHS